MGLTVFGPDDRWPRHQKAFWNQALQAARERGWTYEYLDAPHKAGDLICPAGEHTAKVDKTADSGDFHANRATRIITTRCPHGTSGGPTGKVKERIAAADRLIATAEILITEAQTDMTLIEIRTLGDQRLSELEDIRTRIETVDLTLAELETLEAAALEDALVEAKSPMHISEALDEADTTVTTASETIDRVKSHGSLKDLRRRAATARTQIDELRARLEEFLPEND